MSSDNLDNTTQKFDETPVERSVRVAFEDRFLQFSDGNDRIREFLKKIKLLVADDVMRREVAMVTDAATLVERLQACAQIEDKKSFVDALMQIWRPLAQLQQAKPEIFAEFYQRRFESDEERFHVVNPMISYGIADDDLHFHVADVSRMSIGEKRRLLREGFASLATVIRDNPSIQIVSATSWIVADQHKLMELLGFTIEGPIGQQMRGQHFGGEKRPIERATMKRKDFLARYLKA